MGSNLPQGKERLPKDHATFGWLDLRIVSIRTVDRGLRLKSTTRSIIQSRRESPPDYATLDFS
ncbi:MAG: hypothetical protein O3A82_05155 [Verrucomicrobia bacterium]|jgi:hypothetical protein|nr:hypothetical protein [Verrucomicrobiota bacterium]MDA0723996.1 hypothetical protein [Verrucomicrobiota bacterium]MDA1046299.1 hypothetical protein [Verrucomicrobiota bacterium]